MKSLLPVSLAAALFAGAPAEAQMRFQGMDRNNDGVITRDEWRGNDQSFRNQDWDGDGVLSGDEVRPGARRARWDADWNRDGRVDRVDAQIEQRYRGYDMNGDARVDRREWPADARLFSRLDANRDGYLTLREYTAGGGFNLDSRGGAPFGFNSIDRNRDGWLARSEWPMNARDFDWLDTNNDNRISRFEFENASNGSADEVEHTAAWRTGYDRGIQEGQIAGREDVTRRNGWDLEGQRELQRADSGYTPEMGQLREYQAGYREGFRNAYRAGFIEAGGRAPQ